MQLSIVGTGDVGRRVIAIAMEMGIDSSSIIAYVNQSTEKANALGVDVRQLDLDQDIVPDDGFHARDLIYTIAPQRDGLIDERSRRLINALSAREVSPNKVVLISTTGVYGDQQGEWINESTPLHPNTERAHRRVDSETNWLDFGKKQNVPIVILRVPGIYAFSRLPRDRIEQGLPVIRACDSGYSNRIHADDLARVCLAAIERGLAGEVFNVTDGTPGKVGDFLQAVAKSLGLPRLPEVSLSEAKQIYSKQRLSFALESRKIDNSKMLNQLKVALRYKDYREGIKF